MIQYIVLFSQQTYYIGVPSLLGIGLKQSCSFEEAELQESRYC
jgi:hypothetical protein